MDPLMVASVTLLDRDGAFDPAHAPSRRHRVRRTHDARRVFAQWLRRAAAWIEPVRGPECTPVTVA